MTLDATNNAISSLAGRLRPGRASSTRTSIPGTCPAASMAISRSAAARCTGMSRASSPRTTRARPSSTSSTRAAQHRDGRSRRLRRDARLRPAQHLRRRFDHAGDADYVTYTGVDTEQPDARRCHRKPDGRPVRPAGGALSFAVGYEHREEDGNFIPDPVVAQARRPTSRPIRPRAVMTSTSSTARSSCRCQGQGRLRFALVERRGALFGFGSVR